MDKPVIVFHTIFWTFPNTLLLKNTALFLEWQFKNCFK